MGNVKNVLLKNTMLIMLVSVMLFFQILILATGKGSLFSPMNITNLISQNSYVVILAVGMLLCILTGGNIDLAVGSVVALVSALAGWLVVTLKFNVYASILICLIVATLIGAWQAFWIAYIRIPPFIVTLAGMLTFRGIAWMLLGGKTISPFPPAFTQYFNGFIGGESAFIITLLVGAVVCAVFIISQLTSHANKAKKGYEVEAMPWVLVKLVLVSAVVLVLAWLLGSDRGIPVVLIWIAVVVLAYNYYASNTVPGRNLYVMGGNEKAAKLSGVNTNHTLFFAYTNIGFLAGVSALICVSRFNSAAPSAGDGYELDAIGACFIGGASAFGGVGTVGGAVIGAIFMGVLNQGMSIMGWGSDLIYIIKGLVLLGAVVFDVMVKNRKRVAA